MSITVQVAADAWLTNLETRKRRPAKPATLATFRAYVRAHIGPALGQQDIATIGNAQMREFVAHLAAKKLAPKTIMEVSNAVRQIVASVVDQNGDELFPRKWNSDFIDVPVVEKQNQPSVTSEQIEQAIAKANDADAVLYILLASSALRIGEALALRIGPSESSSYFSDAAVTVHTSLWRRREQDPKTISAFRTVELAEPAAKRIAEFAKGRSGFLFGNGLPPSESAFRDRLSGTAIHGFHALRRFRTTWLRKNRVQEDIIKFWLGHSFGQSDVTDGYSKLAEDAGYRREVAENIGIGFNL
jgi:integrase